MNDPYPACSVEGDRVQAALEATPAATGRRNRDELGGVVAVVAASYQKAFQIRHVVEALVAIPPDDVAGLGTGLEDEGELLRTLATWHATTQNRLFSTAQRVRVGR